MIKHLKKPQLVALMIGIGLIALPHAFHLNVSIFALFCFLLGWRFIGIWKKSWLPKPLLLFLLTLSSLLFLLAQHKTILGRDAGTSLFIIALGLKLMELNKAKDLILVTYLTFIVAASQFLYLQNIFMAAYIFLVCCIVLSTLILMNSEIVTIQVALKQSCTIIVQAIPVMLILFIFFPRLEAPKWMLFSDKHGAKTGLSDTLEPGSISDLGKSDELVFRVKFSDAVPPPEQRYWRGPVLSKTDGNRWTQINNKSSSPAQIKVSGRPYSYTLLLEAQEKNWLFGMDMPTKLPPNTSLNTNYQLLTKHNPNDRAEYQITSYPNFNTGQINSAERADNLQLPGKPSARIKKLVTKFQGHTISTNKFIKNVLNYFSEQDFYYTLQPPLMPENPVETFLFETRRGFCGHYATAFVYLMRAANIPARVVTGYQGGKFNKEGNFLEIRQANAHAWTEVWLDDKNSWVRFDPTAAVAPERIEQDINIDLQIANGEVTFMTARNTNMMKNWIMQTRMLWDNADYQWQRWVVNYTSTSRAGLLSSLGIKKITTLIYWMFGLITGFTAILIALMFFKKKPTSDPAFLIYSRFCSKIAKKGLFITTGEGAENFAIRCKSKFPYLTKQIDDITVLYQKIRYGKASSDIDLKKFKTLVSSFRT